MSQPTQSSVFTEVLHSLEHPLVRDLAWVIGQPHLDELIIDNSDVLYKLRLFETSLNIIRLSSERSLEMALPMLRELEKNPERLSLSLKRSADQHKRVRLGVYFEHLVYFWFEAILNASPLLREQQVFSFVGREKVTLGALDLVGRLREEQLNTLCVHPRTTRSNGMVHLEMASKFYLKVSKEKAHHSISECLPQELFRYLGPNERDSFGSKLHRLYTHQLPLSQKQETIDLLEKKEIRVTDRIRWMKGRLFDHILEANTALEYQSIWLRRQEIPLLYDCYASSNQLIRAILCEKPKWLAPPHLNRMKSAELIDANSLLKRCELSRGEKGSTLWYIASSTLDHFVWVMIVPDDWGEREIS
jgi:hypothetical protein